MQRQRTKSGEVERLTPLLHINIGDANFNHAQRRVLVDVSIPGRDGEMWREWPCTTHWLDPGTVNDIAAFVALAVERALYRFYGPVGDSPPS